MKDQIGLLIYRLIWSKIKKSETGFHMKITRKTGGTVYDETNCSYNHGDGFGYGE